MRDNPTPVFLAAAGIQSPFLHPGMWRNEGVVHIGPVCLAEKRGVPRSLTKSIAIKGLWIPAAAGMTCGGHPGIGVVNAIALIAIPSTLTFRVGSIRDLDLGCSEQDRQEPERRVDGNSSLLSTRFVWSAKSLTMLRPGPASFPA